MYINTFVYTQVCVSPGRRISEMVNLLLHNITNMMVLCGLSALLSSCKSVRDSRPGHDPMHERDSTTLSS